jgi:Zn-dependent peptidase ImmA (M78 family)/transcriptional regulator with XRE-family HTH domain
MQIQSLSKQELGDRLRQARVAQGLTQENAAQHLGISRPTLIAIEKGHRAPSTRELVKLSEIYQIAVNRLLSSSAVHVDFVARFRSTLNHANLTKEQLDAVGLLSRLATAATEVEAAVGFRRAIAYPPEVRIHPKNIEQQAEDAATQFRQRLGVGSGPIPDLISLLEMELGIWVFVRPLAAKVSGVFGYDEKVGACILLNANHPWERRYISAAHESGHFEGYRAFVNVDLEGGSVSGTEERFCKAFSYALTMPAPNVRKKFLELSREGKVFTSRDLILLAHSYYVSPEAMCRRLEELSLLPDGTWKVLKRRGFDGTLVRSVIGDKPAERVLVIPPRLGAIISEAFERGLYSEGQLCEKFALDRVELRTLLDAFPSVT